MRETIIALDFPGKKETLAFLDLFKNEDKKPFVKIGMELFYSEGPDIIKEIKERGHKIFLDLKLHDIPNTVKRAMKVLSQLDVDIVNLHASGGKEMMKGAIEGLRREDGTRPLLIAVTQLTSTDEEMLHKQLLISESMETTIMTYAHNAKESGLDGVVCSPLEVKSVKQKCGDKFLTVTPGIRFSDSKKDDQARFTTPAKAKELGSDFIVVGRPITEAEDPLAAYKKCQKEFASL